jgi:hypothetical protein
MDGQMDVPGSKKKMEGWRVAVRIEGLSVHGAGPLKPRQIVNGGGGEKDRVNTNMQKNMYMRAPARGRRVPTPKRKKKKIENAKWCNNETKAKAATSEPPRRRVVRVR